jgi:hypothetical protein
MIYAVLLACFLPPSVFSVVIAALAGLKLAQRGLRPSPPLPANFMFLLGIWLLFAALALIGPVFIYHRSGQNIEAFKFMFAGAAFLLGAMEGTERAKLHLALPLLLGALTAVYGAEYFVGTFVSQDAALYPPDLNLSAAMLSLFLPFIVLRMKGWTRLVLLGLMIAFAFFVASRALLAMAVLALAISPQNVRDRKTLLVVAVPVSLALLLYSGLSLDNFSDQLRLQILQVSYHYAIGRGLYPFNFGESAFTDFLNIYPIYRRLEIQHAHNLMLQIWVAYGLVPLAVFLTWFGFMVRQSWADKNGILLASLAVLIGFGMIEAMITDIRSFAEVLFLLGYVYAARPGAVVSAASAIPPGSAVIGGGEPTVQAEA